jgi:hypothetical protein
MGEICSTWCTSEMQRTFHSKNMKEKFEDVGLKRTRILGWFLRLLLN